MQLFYTTVPTQGQNWGYDPKTSLRLGVLDFHKLHPHGDGVMGTTTDRQLREHQFHENDFQDQEACLIIQGCRGTLSSGSRSDGFLRMSRVMRSRARGVTCCERQKHGEQDLYGEV